MVWRSIVHGNGPGTCTLIRYPFPRSRSGYQHLPYAPRLAPRPKSIRNQSTPEVSRLASKCRTHTTPLSFKPICLCTIHRMSSPFTIALAATIESHVAAANGTGQAGDVVGVKVPASCLAATRCVKVADLNLGEYRRRTIVRCWRSSYARCMSPVRRDSQTSCTHPEPACTRSSRGLLVILDAEASIWRTNGAARRSGCRESGRRGDRAMCP